MIFNDQKSEEYDEDDEFQVLDLNLDAIQCPYTDEQDSFISIASETNCGSFKVNFVPISKKLNLISRILGQVDEEPEIDFEV